MHEVLSKGALDLKVYKTASGAETFIIRLIHMYDLRQSGNKWPKFKETGTKKNQIGKSGGERKKNPNANPVNTLFNNFSTLNILHN